ncbi:921_t:CDS:2 [Ambispora gerdemannii]|uniref:921_t:CDS:1 n=1 Tax=Ambispora gerdemannii TaxID=144530 RepID=A0A9N9H7R3_9GLOM|nr:921_t:CDS:2 [Ambispora gerdemannii]
MNQQKQQQQKETRSRRPSSSIPPILESHRHLFQESIIRDCQHVLRNAPATSEYPYWDVYVGFMIYPKLALTLAEEYIDSALATYTVENHSELRPSGHICGFLCTAVGLYTVAAYIKHHVGDQESCNYYLDIIQNNFSHTCFSKQTPSELLYGRAGYLYAEKFISDFIDPMKVERSKSILYGVYDAIIDDGVRTANSMNITAQTPMFWMWHDSAYIGAAHGAAGILTILLQFPEKVKEISDQIRDTVDFVLFKCQTEDGNWPPSLDNKKSLVQWCHGAPGVALLACKAYEVYKDQKYLDLAKKAAEFIHSNGVIHKGVGLCHGVSGKAYPFLAIYQLTQEEKYLEWAIEFGVICSKWEEKTMHGEFRKSDRPMSLYEGLAGAIWFFCDLYFWDVEVFKGFPGLTDI